MKRRVFSKLPLNTRNVKGNYGIVDIVLKTRKLRGNDTADKMIKSINADIIYEVTSCPLNHLP